ncbi:hypothetical protein [Saccharothrix variisporea]|uniref:Uncharacterized protein n=1 Tax=Saccharothrix variisporea TaxID=543527 RepID=A0A495XA99_9PSEU|nr:hypothetical protein [Saccharothrix variisporea]RKT70907.1 hypothetical protein DFJ66_4184 [Saccharothrix variisporea]
MSSVDDAIARLRAEADDLTGAARVAPLSRLGQALLQRFQQNGLSAPTALTDLNGAVEAFEEVLGHVGERDPLRVNVLLLLGFALSARNNYLTDGKDMEASIGHLSAALEHDGVPPAAAAGARMMLGQQYLGRAMSRVALGQSMMSMLTAAANQTEIPDVDRAAACFRAVVDGPQVSDDMREMAQMSLEMTEAARAMLGGSPGGYDLQNLMGAMAKLQEMQQKFGAAAKPGYGAFKPQDVFSFSDVGKWVNMNPLDHPVAVVEGAVEEPAVEEAAAVEEVARARPVEPEPEPEPVDVRGLLRKRLGLAEPVWASAARLLSEVDGPAVAVVDDAVALAGTVVDEDEDADVVDWFLVAVTLHLRHRLDPGGDDRRAGAEALLTAARKASPDHPALPVVLRSLGAFLDADEPWGGVLDGVAAGFAGRFDAVLAGGVVTDPEEWADLHALRCVCRAVWALAEAGQAVDRLSPGYPWPGPLKAAVRARA